MFHGKKNELIIHHKNTPVRPSINIEARMKPPEVIWHQIIKVLIGCKLLECVQNVFFVLKKKNQRKI